MTMPPVRQKSHAACHLAHASQSREPGRLQGPGSAAMAGPDSPVQTLARAGRENTRARPAQGLTSDFRGMSALATPMDLAEGEPGREHAAASQCSAW